MSYSCVDTISIHGEKGCVYKNNFRRRFNVLTDGRRVSDGKTESGVAFQVTGLCMLLVTER